MLRHLLRRLGKERDCVLVFATIKSFEALAKTHVESSSCIKLFDLVGFDIVLEAAIIVFCHEVTISSI